MSGDLFAVPLLTTDSLRSIELGAELALKGGGRDAPVVLPAHMVLGVTHRLGGLERVLPFMFGHDGRYCLIDYTNHRRERGPRRIMPVALAFDASEWHPVAQWVLKGFDTAKGDMRDFAVADIHAIEFEPEDEAQEQ